MRTDDEDYDISDEFLRELTEKYSDINHPLFMEELPNDISSNSDLEALHKLLSEGETRDSIAKKKLETGMLVRVEGITKLQSQAIQMELQLKAKITYYRGAIASYKLSLYKQALLFCNECAKAITLDPEIKVFESEKKDNYKLLCIIDDKFGSFYKKILSKYNEFEMDKNRVKQNEKREMEQKLLAEKEAKEFLKSKGFTLKVNLSDYIQDFDYTSSVSDHLDVMFGEGEQFSSKNSLCFYQVSPDEVMKFDLDSPLEKVALKSGCFFKVAVVHIVTDEDALTGFTKI
uniref:Uncharacterized protein n=1 Tax=Theileria annulata TaxID=5874 RepID=A0A3B0MWZ8_THEAN